MFTAIKNQYLVTDNNEFSIAKAATKPESLTDEKKSKKSLRKVIAKIDDLQRVLYAQDKYSVLLIFQAMDAAGKDSTIRAVTRGVNPAGFQVYSFKQPSKLELDHDFLWRSAIALPERGRIGIFNRSYYEEVLVVRVHPEYLSGQRLPQTAGDIWAQRYESIIDHEKHLVRNGTIVLKFWLNVSKQEQKNRFIARIDDPTKNWKFSSGDVKERGYWDDYMHAYEQMLNATSKPWAPWYAIPADDKPYMRLKVAQIIQQTLSSLDLEYPKLEEKERAKLDEMRVKLLEEG